MKLLSKASGIFDRTIGFLAFLGGAVIILITVIVCWDVISRFFLGHGLGWALEGFAFLFLQFLRRAYGYLGSWRALPKRQ